MLCCTALHLAPLEAALGTKQHGNHHKSGATTILCQLAAALAAGGTTHRVQAGRTDLQDTTDISAGVSEPPHHDTQQHAVLRSSSAPLLQVPFGKCSFSTAAPSVWNSLPISVVNYDSLTLFKARLQTHFFSFVSG